MPPQRWAREWTSRGLWANPPRWDRAELEELADELGLFPDAALDMINDYAFEQVGAPVIEGFDELEVDQQLCREVIE